MDRQDELEPDEVFQCKICGRYVEEHHGEHWTIGFICDRCIAEDKENNRRTIEELRKYIREFYGKP